MKLGLSEVKSITSGAVRITEDEKGFHFSRFTEEQENLYKLRSEDFYIKSFSTSGIKLCFTTDSNKLSLKGAVYPGSTRTYYAFEIFCNDIKLGGIQNFEEASISADYTTQNWPLGEFSKSFDLPQGMNKVTILLPWTVKAVIKELEVDDNAAIVPVKRKNKVLCFGDSFTQGYDALYPSSKYISRLAQYLDGEEYNKAIGGERFYPELALTKDSFTPDFITIAYGGNDRYGSSEEELTMHCSQFFENVRKNYPDVKIIAIAPLRCEDYVETCKMKAFSTVAQTIERIAKSQKNIIYIPACDYVPREGKFFADNVHLNDTGLDLFCKNLLNEMDAIGGVGI